MSKQKPSSLTFRNIARTIGLGDNNVPTYLVVSIYEIDDSTGEFGATLHYAGDYQTEAFRELKAAIAEGYGNVMLANRG